MDTVLLEIGSEEIPAGYIVPALTFLASNLMRKLDDARVTHGKARTYGTPKRIAVEIEGVAPQQTTLKTEIMGPPAKAGYDENGKPTVAAEKFAEKVHLPLSDIHIKETPKGRYLCASVVETGRGTVDILKSLLPDMVQSIPFPKTMKWADQRVQFARPIHSILALYGSEIIPFDVGNITSNRHTSGHRFMAPDKISISEPHEYVEALRQVKVVADVDARRKMVLEEVSKTAEHLAGKVLPDNELVDIVTNLVEYPVAVAGKFDEAFLEIPDKVLITSMREHQKYFAVVDQHGKLMPCFIAVNNTHAADMAVVAKGHERVLRARLNDARFFYRADLETPLDTCVERLKGVLFQAKLGSVYDKTLRVQKLAEFIAARAGLDDRTIDMASRAARLCKADLVTQMVVEFPKLQGAMGRVYAAKSGEPEAVSTAIEEHYLPAYSGGPLPETVTGAVLSIADKIDSLCGCFSIGLTPTGASDPYALRRQAIGIIQIMLNQKFMFPLSSVLETSLKLYERFDTSHISETMLQLQEFLQNRMAFLLVEQGAAKDSVAAVLSVGAEPIPDVWNRVSALEALKSAPDFEPLATAFKRVVNIIRKSDVQTAAQKVDTSLFQDASESGLYTAFQQVKTQVDGCMGRSDFSEALRAIASLRNAVDAFFDAVLVMADDPAVRNNRLALLAGIASMFDSIADFTRISV